MPFIEKRRFYRINDVVGLRCALYDSDDPRSCHSDNLAITLPHLLDRIEDEFSQITDTLWRENPGCAEALDLLNKKMNLLSDAVMKQESIDGALFEKTPVNISACGIAFQSESLLEQGSQIHLQMYLRPSNVTLAFHGRVVSCERNHNSGHELYLLRIDFVNPDPVAQEQLIQHIVQRQCAQLGESRDATG